MMSIVSTASDFLDRLERLRRSGEELPVPFMMMRINGLLTELVSDRLQHSDGRANSYRKPAGTHHGPSGTSYARAVRDSVGWPKVDTWRKDDDEGEEYEVRRKSEVSPRRWLEGGEAIWSFKRALDAIASVKEPIYIDVLYLSSTSGYVVKEFAVSCPATRHDAWITVRSPNGLVQIRDDNTYFVDHVHGVHWETGIVEKGELRELTSKIFSDDRVVYIKGREKRGILLDYLDIGNYQIKLLPEFPKLKHLRRSYSAEPCPLHSLMSSSMACARKHAAILSARSAESAV